MIIQQVGYIHDLKSVSVSCVRPRAKPRRPIHSLGIVWGLSGEVSTSRAERVLVPLFGNILIAWIFGAKPGLVSVLYRAVSSSPHSRLES